MVAKIKLDEERTDIMNGDDYYAQVAAAMIGVVAGLLGGLFVL